MDNLVFVVVRYSNVDQIDVVMSLNDIIQKKGYCWFGKYGANISIEKIKNLLTTNHRLILILVRNIRQTKLEKIQIKDDQFEIEEVSYSKPDESDSYPSYYNKNIKRISTWIKVKPLSTEKYQLSKLVTFRSGSIILSTLAKSSRSHFFCRLN